MSRHHFLIVVALATASQLTISADRCYCVPPLQTLNFDFGGGAAYVGDDGVISSPGGTYWNAVDADNLTELWNVGTDILDEFGQPTNAILFSAYPAGWVNSQPAFYQGPRSDGIQPSMSKYATLTIGRVNTFEEMIIYLNGPVGELSPPSSYGGGFAPFFDTIDVVQPFPFTFGIGSSFPGMEGFDYLRIRTRPPLAGLLGFGKTLSIVLEDSRSIISAIQIRGRFQGAPEPASIVLILSGSSAALFRRTPLRSLLA